MSKPINFTVLEKALHSFESAVNPPPLNDRERDGAIQRFEFTFELSWKMGKRVLEELGIFETSPREVIRELAVQRLISSSELWLRLLNLRNISSHVYSDAQAQEVYLKSQEAIVEVRTFIANCKSRLPTG